MLPSVKSQYFNWKGVTDNGDGSFNADDKRAKTRLLKEFHQQGAKVRSVKIEGDGYRVEPIGTLSRRKSDDPFRNRRLERRGTGPRSSSYQRRIVRPAYQRAPPTTQYTNRQIPRAPSSPYYGAPPRARGRGIISATQDYLKKRQIEKEQKRIDEIKRKKDAQEIDAKMRAERIQAEREETARQVRKNELHAEQVQFQREQDAERQRQANLNQPRHTNVQTTTQLPAGYANPVLKTSPLPEKSVSNADLQKARENYITDE
jgi:hypothetical protein